MTRASRRSGRSTGGALRGPRVVLLAGAALAGSMVPAVAQAQVYGQLLESEIPLSTETGRNRGVRERARPELDPQGLPAGGFRLYPEVGGGVGYTSNVIGTEDEERGDFFAALTPQVTARSQWGRHALAATFNYDGRRYFDTPRRNEDGFLASLDGTLELVGESELVTNLSYRRTYEPQTEASFPGNGGGAIAINSPRAAIRGTYALNRIRLTASADVNRFDYLSTVTTTGTELNLDFRDRNVTRGSVRAEYAVTPDNAVFGQFTFRHTDYDLKSTLTDRTSDEWRALAGGIADVTNLVRVAGALGYFHRTYANPAFANIGGLAIDMRADFFASPITTISAVASRQVEEAIVVGSSGYIATRVGARVDHELLRNLIPYAYFDFATEDFVGIDRTDRRFRVGAGADYQLRRVWTVSPVVDYVTRKSNGDLRGPQINELRALLTLQFRP